MKKIINFAKFLKEYKRQIKNCCGSNIKFLNWYYKNVRPEDTWLYQFIYKHALLKESSDTTIAFFSVFGSPIAMRLNRSKIKIFYTEENVHRDQKPVFSFKKYQKNALDLGMDLGLGFDYLDDERYLRLPIWIRCIIEAGCDYDWLVDLCKTINNPVMDFANRKRGFSLISRHDTNGLRGDLYEALKNISHIECAGEFLNNTDELGPTLDEKVEYMKQFKFNICPENTNAEGYVTEKAFQAIQSGCIPIYWGSNNNPEPDILNHDAIIFWNKDGDNSSAMKLIKDLYNNEKLYKEFTMQQRLKPKAADVIWEMLVDLENKLRQLIKAKRKRFF